MSLGRTGRLMPFVVYRSYQLWVDPGEVSIPSNPIPRGEGNGDKGLRVILNNLDKIPLEILDEILSPEIPVISPVYAFKYRKYWKIIMISLLSITAAVILLFLGWFSMWKLTLVILAGLILLGIKNLWIKEIITRILK